MWSGWSHERVGSWQRRHSSAEDGQRVHPGQQLLVYGRHAYATGQRPQPQGKRVITESGSQLLKQVMRFEIYNVWKLVGHLSQLYVCVGKNVYRKNFTIFTQERFMIISKIKEWKYSKWLIVKIWRDEYIFFSVASIYMINIINKFNRQSWIKFCKNSEWHILICKYMYPIMFYRVEKSILACKWNFSDRRNQFHQESLNKVLLYNIT